MTDGTTPALPITAEDEALMERRRRMTLGGAVSMLTGTFLGVVGHLMGPSWHVATFTGATLVAATLFCMGLISNGTILGKRLRRPLFGDIGNPLAMVIQVGSLVAFVLHVATMS